MLTGFMIFEQIELSINVENILKETVSAWKLTAPPRCTHFNLQACHSEGPVC